MNSGGDQQELALYEFLRDRDTHSAQTQHALGFARVFADLARRVVAAKAAQEGDEVTYPPGITQQVLSALLDSGPGGLAETLSRRAEESWPLDYAYLLSDLAGWLVTLYEPQKPQCTSLQVWVGPPGQQTIQLYGWASAQAAELKPPPAPFVLAGKIPVEPLLASCAPDQAGLLSHYDVHGLSMLALTLRYLHGLGVTDPDCALGFEWTGDIGKLWKRAVPRSLSGERGLRAVLMLDTSVHSRKPQHTLRAVAKLEDNPDTQLILIDHHPDTFLLAPQLMHERLHLVLTDVFSCGLTSRWERTELEIMALGAIGDKVPEIATAYSAASHPKLHAASEDYHRWHLHFSPTPKEVKARGEYPLRPLWEALASGEEVSTALSTRVLGALPPAERPPDPEFQQVGGVLVVTSQIQAMGRAWYGMLEELMAGHNLGYAIATRLLDKRRANFLLLTRWQWTHVPPVRFFIPERYIPMVLGHPGAIWADMDKDQAPAFLREVLAAVNGYLGLPADSSEAIASIRQNILEADPVRTELASPGQVAQPEADDDD